MCIIIDNYKTNNNNRNLKIAYPAAEGAKHNVTNIMYIEMENVVRNLTNS